MTLILARIQKFYILNWVLKKFLLSIYLKKTEYVLRYILFTCFIVFAKKIRFSLKQSITFFQINWD